MIDPAETFIKIDSLSFFPISNSPIYSFKDPYVISFRTLNNNFINLD